MKEKNYCITPANLEAHEMLGLKAKIVKSSALERRGLSGVITRESKNTFTLEKKGATKIVPKKEVWLEIELPNEAREKVLVEGAKIVSRPEDRTKKFWRKKNG